VKVLVSGSRTWIAQAPIERVLRQLPPGSIIVHGDAAGVDRIAGFVAELCGFTVRKYPALAHGRTWPSAGPLRNQEMMDKEHVEGEYFDQAFFWHEDPQLRKGTRDMHQRVLLAVPAIPIEVFIGRGR
jgi:hypothetical protein